MINIKFEYAIQFPDGSFYNGNAGPNIKTNKPLEVYTYTQEGAYKKKQNFPCFSDCKVVKYF